MTLLLQTGGACDFDPGHLLDVFERAAAAVRHGPPGIRSRRLGCPDPVRRLVRA